MCDYDEIPEIPCETYDKGSLVCNFPTGLAIHIKKGCNLMKPISKLFPFSKDFTPENQTTEFLLL